jgi:hypothetical protein
MGGMAHRRRQLEDQSTARLLRLFSHVTRVYPQRT